MCAELPLDRKMLCMTLIYLQCQKGCCLRHVQRPSVPQFDREKAILGTFGSVGNITLRQPVNALQQSPILWFEQVLWFDVFTSDISPREEHEGLQKDCLIQSAALCL